jgi:ribose 5-phosphate isomerase B
MVDFNNPVAIAADHAGFALKEFLKEKLSAEGFVFKDFGTYSTVSMDYPDVIHPLARAIEDKELSGGIIICGSGNGAAMVANKYKDVRAALCWNEEVTKLARQHNNANVISIPARFVSQENALNFVRVFFTTGFEGGRHQVRVNKISGSL